MFRRTRALAFVTCLAGCGSFLGLSGDDEEDDTTPPLADIDGSTDGVGGAEGGSEGDAGTPKTNGTADAAIDVKVVTDAAVDGPTLKTFRYVFVTGRTYAGSFMVNGANADALCKTRADDFGIAALQGRTWRAWISTTAENAATNIGGQGALPYRLANGTTKVADNFADLVDGSLDHAIDRTEANVEILEEPVWTGSSPAGALITVNCTDWTSVAQGMNGKFGVSNSMTGTWSESGDQACTAQARLYCFEL